LRKKLNGGYTHVATGAIKDVDEEKKSAKKNKDVKSKLHP